LEKLWEFVLETNRGINYKNENEGDK